MFSATGGGRAQIIVFFLELLLETVVCASDQVHGYQLAVFIRETRIQPADFLQRPVELPAQQGRQRQQYHDNYAAGSGHG